MSNDVRRRILDVTLDLIGEHGIGGLSNRNVAKAAGISLGTLTYHFSSQDELLGQALQLFVDDEIERLTVVADELDTHGAQRGLDEILSGARETIEQSAARTTQIAQLELYLHATRNPDLQQVAARCYEAYDRVATSALRALGVPDPERLAPLVGALIDGFELRRLAVDDLEVDLAEGLAALASGLTTGTPTTTADIT